MAAFEIRTVIDLQGNIISSSTRPVTMAELAPLFDQASERGLDLHRGSELERNGSTRENKVETNHTPARAQPQRERGTRRMEISDQKINEARRDHRELLEYARGLRCDAHRTGSLIVEFGDRTVSRALAWMGKLVESGEQLNDPTALLVSQVVRMAGTKKSD